MWPRDCKPVLPQPTLQRLVHGSKDQLIVWFSDLLIGWGMSLDTGLQLEQHSRFRGRRQGDVSGSLLPRFFLQAPNLQPTNPSYSERVLCNQPWKMTTMWIFCNAPRFFAPDQETGFSDSFGPSHFAQSVSICISLTHKPWKSSWTMFNALNREKVRNNFHIVWMGFSALPQPLLL